MTPAEILAFFGKAAANAFLAHVAKKSVSAFTEEILNGLSIKATTDQKKKLVDLLEWDDRPWWNSFAGVWDKMIAESKFADRNGVLFVGPSGAGKSTLMDAICKTEGGGDRPTTEVDGRFILMSRKITKFREIPGEARYWLHLEDCVQKYQPAILVVVMADGFLENAGHRDTGLIHPDIEKKKKFRSLDAYLKACREHERWWIRDFAENMPTSKVVKYFVLFVNKAELWNDAPSQDYGDTDFQESLNKAAAKLGRMGSTFIIANGSAGFDNSFKGLKNALVQYNRRDGRASIRAFKALLASLLAEGQLSL